MLVFKHTLIRKKERRTDDKEENGKEKNGNGKSSKGGKPDFLDLDKDGDKKGVNEEGC